MYINYLQCQAIETIFEIQNLIDFFTGRKKIKQRHISFVPG
jgi:hypothetical protein